MLAGSRLVGAALVTVAVAVSALGAASSRAAADTTCMGEQATMVGTDGNDSLNGSAAPDVIAGLGGDDIVAARGGSDVVLADPGNDSLDGGASSGDTIEFLSAPRRVSVNLASGKASGMGADRLTGFEHVYGTKY